STRLWEQDAAAMSRALERHDVLMRSAIEGHDGSIVKHRGEGDSFFAVFARARDAVAAACAIQTAMRSEPWSGPVSIRVRAALHAGEAELRDGDYFGPAVIRCARMRAVAHGGQTLLSQTVFDLSRDSLPLGASIHDLGEHRLRDLSRAEHIFQLEPPGVATDFPPLTSLGLVPNNLPVQLTSFVGRENELAQVAGLLGDCRLVTLSGPGGSGKTRLALQAAGVIIERFAYGVFYVALDRIADPDMVMSAIAEVLGVRESGDRPLVDRLKGYLAGKDLLLVLDNFEQVVGAAAQVGELLASCPKLRVMVTSRISLRLSSEQEFVVAPLRVPDLSQVLAVDQLTQCPAVALFVERASRVSPDFRLTTDNAPAVAAICVRLDGLPLALELAATRTRLLPPRALLAQIERPGVSPLRLLSQGDRDLPPRHHTLRNTIIWSYELLSPAEQRLLRRLAVFVGGGDLGAAEDVCPRRENGDGGPDDVEDLGVDIIEGIASLIESSMMRREEGPDGEVRFSMLETIREFALEELEGSGEGAAIRERHARYYLKMVEGSGPVLLGAPRDSFRLAAERGNIQAALRWLVTPA
ncbi:MAG: adenylate/guanylate cyclase domain-containing protein, partial [Chloroflexota bacterium]|nr:adenylate/guanylate cyclase domain-containing protein [Chloroflexota bacterium]